MDAKMGATNLRHDWAWLAALVAGASYMWAVHHGLTGPAIIAWKGAGVGLLCLWAALNARHRDGWQIAAVLGFGALGDVLIDAAGLVPGALSFAVGHVLAINLYIRNRRPSLSLSQQRLAVMLAPATVLISWLLVINQDGVIGVVFYAFLLGLMASSAWISRFSRYRVGIGAVLFVVSDWLIFARLGGQVDSAVARMLIWPLYFAGQALIARGVVARLAEDS